MSQWRERCSPSRNGAARYDGQLLLNSVSIKEIIAGGEKMECRIEGNLAQYVRLTFGEGDQCWASKGSLITFDPEVQWSLKVPGGVSGATRRMFSGESVALTLIEASRDGAQVILSSNLPGKVITWDLDQGGVITTRGSFVGAFGSAVEINVMVAKRTGTALFGGAGLFMTRLRGPGRVLLQSLKRPTSKAASSS